MELLKDLPTGFWIIWGFVIGAAVGSFLNVVIYRIPRAESLLSPSSHCTQCKRPIKPWNNIPLLSYWLLGGKCPDCGARFSIRYFFVELLGAIIPVWSLLVYGVSWEALGGILLGWHLVAIAMIDLETYTIPDHLVIPMGLCGVITAFLVGGLTGLVDAAIAVAVGTGFQLIIYFVSRVMRRYKGEEGGMGSGDVTMTAGFSVYMHPLVVPFALVASSAFGILGSLILSWFRRKKLEGRDRIPFGPYLALGAWFAYLYGGELINAYISWALNRVG